MGHPPPPGFPVPILIPVLTKKRGEERFREEGETAKKTIGRREKGRRKITEEEEMSKKIQGGGRKEGEKLGRRKRNEQKNFGRREKWP